jgi:gamma-glutamyltranspeptidase/glutathione hydrolase
MRMGFAEAAAWVGDPTSTNLPMDELLSVSYGARLRAQLDDRRAMPQPRTLLAAGDTVYLATIDGEGNACSFINSNYMGFGSGLVAGETGIALQNRGAGFTLVPGHPNSLEPAKRPFHTIIPALSTLASDGSLYAVFGVMGGHMQPQGHVQVVTNLLDFGFDPQRALDAPRWQLTGTQHVALEPWFSDGVRMELERRGHPLVGREATPRAATFGGGQIIAVTPEGVRVGGSDPRKDGAVVAAPLSSVSPV